MDITIPRTKLDENELSNGKFKTLTIELNIPSDSEWNCNLNITENKIKIGDVVSIKLGEKEAEYSVVGLSQFINNFGNKITRKRLGRDKWSALFFYCYLIICLATKSNNNH